MEYLLLILLLISLGVAFYFKESKFVINLIGQTIVEIERDLNGKDGQQKLEEATKRIREKLPPYLSLFFTKAMIVNMIEFMLNVINKGFGLDYKVDVKGNESKIDIDIEDNKLITEYKTEVQENNLRVYGKLKGETDFKGRNNATIEVGFEKRF